jgi:hypothetical protein
MFCPALRSCLFVFLICVLLAKVDSSFSADRPGDDLSTAFGTETLAERDMIPEGFPNTSTSRIDMSVEVIGGGKYLLQTSSLQTLGNINTLQALRSDSIRR